MSSPPMTPQLSPPAATKVAHEGETTPLSQHIVSDGAFPPLGVCDVPPWGWREAGHGPQKTEGLTSGPHPCWGPGPQEACVGDGLLSSAPWPSLSAMTRLWGAGARRRLRGFTVTWGTGG